MALDFDTILKYVPDILPFKEKAFEEARQLLNGNEDRFKKENIVSQPQYAWLDKVECILFKPDSNDTTIQKQQLDNFIEQLKTEAFYLEYSHLPKLLPKDYKEPVLGFDTETTGLDTRTLYDVDGKIDLQVELVGISLAVNENKGWYIPVMHSQSDGVLNWDKELIKEFLSTLNREFCLIIHNAAYDRQVIALNGASDFRSYPYFFDTQILYYLLNTDNNLFGLKHLSETVLNRKMIDIWDLFKTDKSEGVDFIRFDFISASNAYLYACSDATNTFYLFKELCSNKSKTNPLVYQEKPVEIDHKLIDTLICMCRHGLPVDVHYSIHALKDVLLRTKQITAEIYKEAGNEINLGSGKQLSELIFDTLQIPPLPGMERNKSGYYSTDEDTLTALQEKYPDIKFLKYCVMRRKLENASAKFYSKFIKNSYVDALHPYSRVYLGFSQTRATTGRLASASNGEMENITLKEIKPTKKNPDTIKYKYVLGDASAGVNSQGFPSARYILETGKELINIPQEVLDMSNQLDESIEIDFLKSIVM